VILIKTYKRRKVILGYDIHHDFQSKKEWKKWACGIQVNYWSEYKFFSSVFYYTSSISGRNIKNKDFQTKHVRSIY
jgi:hypothetical protein